MTDIKTVLFALCLSMALSAGAFAQKLPKTTKEGLELASSEGSVAVYLRPDTDLTRFRNVRILKAYVAFKENWMRDYNRNALRSNRLTDADLEDISKRMAEGFTGEFTTAFTEAGYGVVDTAADDLMILRPAILEVAMDAPKSQAGSTGGGRVIDFGTGTQMSLVLELFDASDSSLVARIFNRETENVGQNYAVDSSQLNRSTEARIFRNWADQVVSLLSD